MRKTLIVSLGVILLLLVTVVWQYYLTQGYRQQLEGQYQRAFREFATHVNGLEQEISKVLVTRSVEQQFANYGNILRLVYVAQANIGQLPISGLNISRIENLLAEIQNQIVRNSREFLQDGSISLTNMEQLYEQTQYLNGKLQISLAEWELESSWLEWKRYFQASVTRTSNVIPGKRNPLLQSVVMIEDGMQRFPKSSFSAELDRLKTPSLKGALINENDAIRIAENFFADLVDNYQFSVTNESQGELPTFTVEGTGDSQKIIAEISQAKGLVLWFTNPRAVNQKRYSLDEVTKHAKDFLVERNFKDVILVGWEEFQNRKLLTFAPIEDSFLIYPQVIKVQVATDNGEILGFNGMAYHMFEKKRQFSASLSIKDAEKNIQATGQIIDNRLTVIFNSNYEEILAYEFRIEQNDQQFLVYVNSDNGYQEKVVRVQPGEIISW